jgi:hypothetical protein
MSRRYQLICALLLISLCAGLRISSAQPKLPTAVIPPAPPGYLLVDEEMWSQLADEAGRHLDRAREGFLHGHTRTTAMELHKAAIMMRIDAMHWEDHADQLLLKSAHELEQLAHQLKSPQSITTLMMLMPSRPGRSPHSRSISKSKPIWLGSIITFADRDTTYVHRPTIWNVPRSELESRYR